MALKIWRGDAPAVAQVTTVTADNVEIGDVFTLSINGKDISYTATAATPSDVATGLAAAIDATDIPEFQELETSVASGVLTLTAATPGVPFEITGSTSNDGGGGVTIATTTQGSAAASEVQEFDINETAASGLSFYISFAGVETAALTVGDSAATVETAIEGLSSVGAGNVSVSKSTAAIGVQTVATYEVTFQSSLASSDVPLLAVRIESADPLIENKVVGAPGTNEVQTVRIPTSDLTGETFTLTVVGETTGNIAADSVTASGIQTAINFVLDYGTTGRYVAVTDGEITNTFDVEFLGTLAGFNIADMTGSGTWLAADGDIPVGVEATTDGGAATNEVQTVTLDGPPTGGTFTLSFDGDTTSAIAYNAAASAVQSALQALGSIGLGAAGVTGSAGGPYTVTFQGTLAATNVAQMTGDGSSLTGAATQTLTVTTTTASSGPNHYDDPLNWSPENVPVNGDDIRFELGDSDCLYGLDQSAVAPTSLEIRSSFTGAIGLPRINENDYVEYRDRELQIACASILIGHGDGAGSGKIALDTGTTDVQVEVRNTGGTSEPGVPAVTWQGTNVGSDLVVMAGDFGTSVWSDQSSTFDTIKIYGGTVRIDNATLSDLYAPGQSVTAHNSTLGGQPLEL